MITKCPYVSSLANYLTVAVKRLPLIVRDVYTLSGLDDYSRYYGIKSLTIHVYQIVNKQHLINSVMKCF